MTDASRPTSPGCTSLIELLRCEDLSPRKRRQLSETAEPNSAAVIRCSVPAYPDPIMVPQRRPLTHKLQPLPRALAFSVVDQEGPSPLHDAPSSSVLAPSQRSSPPPKGHVAGPRLAVTIALGNPSSHRLLRCVLPPERTGSCPRACLKPASEEAHLRGRRRSIQPHLCGDSACLAQFLE